MAFDDLLPLPFHRVKELLTGDGWVAKVNPKSFPQKFVYLQNQEPTPQWDGGARHEIIEVEWFAAARLTRYLYKSDSPTALPIRSTGTHTLIIPLNSNRAFLIEGDLDDRVRNKTEPSYPIVAVTSVMQVLPTPK